MAVLDIQLSPAHDVVVGSLRDAAMRGLLVDANVRP